MVSLLSFLIKSTALSFSPYRSQMPIIPTVSPNRVAVRWDTNDEPSVSKISIKVIVPFIIATKPVIMPAATTVAIVSHLRINPTTTNRTPTNLNSSMRFPPFMYAGLKTCCVLNCGFIISKISPKFNIFVNIFY